MLIIFDSRSSLFGKGVFDALNGGASKDNKTIVTLQDFFEQIQLTIKNEIGRIAAEASTGAVPHQSVVLVVPKSNPSVVNNPICYRCGPPTAPERPFIVRVGRNEVTLQWYNPLFDGIAAMKYKIYMRNVSRCFCDWHPIAYRFDITKMKYTVKNLPSGVSCAFRITGYNNGGWGLPSEETPMITPGEEFDPLPQATRWRKLMLGGPLAVLDRLALYPDHRHEHSAGLHKLLAFAMKTNGFHKGNLN